MEDWFKELAGLKTPKRDDLSRFVAEVMRFFDYVLTSDNSSPLWQLDRRLREMATAAFRADVKPAASRLRKAIKSIPRRALSDHGLIGASARFKYNVMAAVSKGWGKTKKQFTIGGGFGRIIDAIDALLDSLIEACGVGGAVKEFKDALRALAPAE